MLSDLAPVLAVQADGLEEPLMLRLVPIAVTLTPFRVARGQLINDLLIPAPLTSIIVFDSCIWSEKMLFVVISWFCLVFE